MTLMRFLRRLASAEVMGLILILIALQAFTYGISSSLRKTNTSSFFWIAILAMLLAWGLNKLPLNGIQTSVCMTMLGILGIWIIAAQLALPLFGVGQAIVHLLPHIRLPGGVDLGRLDLTIDWRVAFVAFAGCVASLGFADDADHLIRMDHYVQVRSTVPAISG